MKRNAPQNYICPVCLGIQGIENRGTLLRKTDLVYCDDIVSVWINAFWIKGNEGHVIVVPNEHFENIYEIPENVGHRIFEISKLMSEVIKQSYDCDGITLRQNNEPAGDQHAFHYHLHIFPRYKDDNFNKELTKKSFLSDPKERSKFAFVLKKRLDNIG